MSNKKAAEIAVRTVQKYKKETGSKLEVIFNVFTRQDERIYRELLSANKTAEKGNHICNDTGMEKYCIWNWAWA